MALNVGLDECQLALDELVRKGAANVDVDYATGVASYSFPEFSSAQDRGDGAFLTRARSTAPISRFATPRRPAV